MIPLPPLLPLYTTTSSTTVESFFLGHPTNKLKVVGKWVVHVEGFIYVEL